MCSVKPLCYSVVIYLLIIFTILFFFLLVIFVLFFIPSLLQETELKNYYAEELKRTTSVYTAEIEKEKRENKSLMLKLKDNQGLVEELKRTLLLPVDTRYEASSFYYYVKFVQYVQLYILCTVPINLALFFKFTSTLFQRACFPGVKREVWPLIKLRISRR